MEVSNIFMQVILFISLYFEVFVLITYFEKWQTIKNEELRAKIGISPDKIPTVSIIVPCFNEEKNAAATIESLISLKYPKEKMEIIAIDDGSTDNTWNELKKFEGYPFFKAHQKTNGGKYTALNLGIERSKGEFVGCLDADSFVDSNALINIMTYFKNDRKAMAVIPSIKVSKPKTILQHVQRVEYNTWGIFIRKMFSYLGAIYVTPGPFSIFRREVFRKLGNYRHAHNTEDMEIAMRLQANQYKIVNCHTAHIYTIAPSTLKKLYKQRLRWTYGFLKNAIDYKFLFFRRKYGNLGMFIIPLAAISVFLPLYVLGSLVWQKIIQIFDELIKLKTVGFNWNIFHWHFDWFFLNTSSSFFLAVIFLALTITLIMLGKKMADGHAKLSLDMFYFFAIYWFIAPLWLSKAVYNVIFSKTTGWK